MKPIKIELLNRFIKLAAKKLSGDWVVIGGSVLALLDSSSRETLDIDIVGPNDSKQIETIRLMEIAETLGLPVEAINQAGALFLNRIRNWKKDLILIHQGKRSAFYRPNLTLFILLKMNRLTETDLLDCLAVLSMKQFRNEIKTGVLFKEIKKRLREPKSEAMANRLKKLLEKIEAKSLSH